MALRFWRVQMLWANSMLPTLRPRIASSMNSISMLASLFPRTRPGRVGGGNDPAHITGA